MMIRIKTKEGLIINPLEEPNTSYVNHESMMSGERISTEEARKRSPHTPTLKEYQERGNCTEWETYLREVGERKNGHNR